MLQEDTLAPVHGLGITHSGDSRQDSCDGCHPEGSAAAEGNGIGLVAAPEGTWFLAGASGAVAAPRGASGQQTPRADPRVSGVRSGP